MKHAPESSITLPSPSLGSQWPPPPACAAVTPASAPIIASTAIVASLRAPAHRVLLSGRHSVHPAYTGDRRRVPAQPRSTAGSTDSAMRIASRFPRTGLEAERESGVLPDQHVPGHEQSPHMSTPDTSSELVLARGPERLAALDDHVAESVGLGGELLGGDLPASLELHEHGARVRARDPRQVGSSGATPSRSEPRSSPGSEPTCASSTHTRAGGPSAAGRAAGNPAMPAASPSSISRPRSSGVATCVGSEVGRPGSTSTVTAPSSTTRRAASAAPTSARSAAASTSRVRRRLGSDSRGATSDGAARSSRIAGAPPRPPRRVWAATRCGRRARRGVRRAARRSCSAAARSSLLHLRQRHARRQLGAQPHQGSRQT